MATTNRRLWIRSEVELLNFETELWSRASKRESIELEITAMDKSRELIRFRFAMASPFVESRTLLWGKATVRGFRRSAPELSSFELTAEQAEVEIDDPDPDPIRKWKGKKGKKGKKDDSESEGMLIRAINDDNRSRLLGWFLFVSSQHSSLEIVASGDCEQYRVLDITAGSLRLVY